jgi:hypothetical protein
MKRRSYVRVPIVVAAMILVVLLVMVLVQQPWVDDSVGVNTGSDGQPVFPALKTDWVIDNGCNFSPEVKAWAEKTFAALDQEHISRVAVVCQRGVKGGYSEATKWISDWLNFVKLGSLEDKRAVAILIRPDVKRADYSIIINPNDYIYWWTSLDEYDIKHEAADFANYDDFDGCLESLTRNVDAFMRAKWEVYKNQQ